MYLSTQFKYKLEKVLKYSYYVHKKYLSTKYLSAAHPCSLLSSGEITWKKSCFDLL